MLERGPLGDFEVFCDECPGGYETFETDDFNVAVTEIKATGWRISKVRGEWHHTCPDCAAEEFEPYNG